MHYHKAVSCDSSVLYNKVVQVLVIIREAGERLLAGNFVIGHGKDKKASNFRNSFNIRSVVLTQRQFPNKGK